MYPFTRYPPAPKEPSPATTTKTGTSTSKTFCHVFRRTHHPSDLDADGWGNASGGYHFPSEASHQSSLWGLSLIPTESTPAPNRSLG